MTSPLYDATEITIIRGISEGLKLEEIASQNGLLPSTMERRSRAIFKKSGADNKLQLLINTVDDELRRTVQDSYADGAPVTGFRTLLTTVESQVAEGTLRGENLRAMSLRLGRPEDTLRQQLYRVEEKAARHFGKRLSLGQVDIAALLFKEADPHFLDRLGTGLPPSRDNAAQTHRPILKRQYAKRGLPRQSSAPKTIATGAPEILTPAPAPAAKVDPVYTSPTTPKSTDQTSTSPASTPKPLLVDEPAAAKASPAESLPAQVLPTPQDIWRHDVGLFVTGSLARRRESLSEFRLRLRNTRTPQNPDPALKDLATWKKIAQGDSSVSLESYRAAIAEVTRAYVPGGVQATENPTAKRANDLLSHRFYNQPAPV